MAYGDSPFSRLAMAQALRQRDPNATAPSGGGGGTVGRGMGGLANAQQPMVQQNQNSQNPIDAQSAQNMMKYFQALKYGGGPTAAAGQSAMPAMMAGGDSSLGAMGLQQGAVNFPGAAPVGGGGGAAGAGGAGMFGTGGMLAGLAALSHLTDKEMNESRGSIINADKLNNMGTIGDSGIGLRGGDLVNGFNPATWLSDPKKAAKGLGNAFTFGLLDKIL